MFIELVDLLRCTRSHQESWLVASLDVVRGRVIVSGTLGCPVCSAEYGISEGIVGMDLTAHEPVAQPSLDLPAPDPWRIAALLDLRPPASVAVLEGPYALAADAVLEIFPGSVVALNPPVAPAPRERLATVRAPGRVPLRSASVDAIATSSGEARAIGDSARVLRTGGRLLAPADVPLPVGLREIARDEREWVAVSELATAAVQLTRR